ncbi:hypothetical protein RHGRI_033754 [Rhododendron griersonianum]|uniref:Uncharacterized protein n=1 Tax=Rhododendron griersonianum TaxID=479676 RepID=A0AAV6I176_9ERIC|nr:hypothetical protein RHGRI_033754 [Rhododendron griersonianum]
MLSGVRGGRPPPRLPQCHNNNDCLPICRGCGFCVCLDNVCCSGCALDHSTSGPNKTGVPNKVASP